MSYVIEPNALIDKYAPRPWYAFWRPRKAMVVLMPNNTLRTHPSNVDAVREFLDQRALPYSVAPVRLGVAK